MVELQWHGGEHKFALKIGELRALQGKLDSGPEEVLNRLRLGTWRVDDIIQVLRISLIGGGMDPEKARELVVNIVELHPIIEFKLIALRVLAAGLMGETDDPVGEPQGAEDAPENGSSAPSTDQAQ